ncbi:tetraspanin-6-like isoform X1 [Rhineura floridana]|uniref:tetraspanin-6-like isoform X1 n=1 Tax=Rhineura floridana TaxID=261503 RepID=UPI002AC81357|nr:tetraspanin-6-like isoform X1 [Rhineura floridana]
MKKKMLSWKDLLKLISGVVLLCIGVSIQVKLRDTFVVVNDAASGVPVIITVIGTLVVIVSAFGAVALLKQSPKMIKLFTGMLLALLILEIIVGATAYTYRGKFQCCGAENYTDWLNTTFGSLSSSVPRSCCKVPGENCVTDLSKHTVGINQQGCVRKLKNWVDEHIAVFGGVGIFVGLAQLSWIPFCYLLLRILKENYERIE